VAGERRARFVFTALPGTFWSVWPGNAGSLVSAWGLEAVQGTLRLYPPKPGVAAAVFGGVMAAFLAILLIPILFLKDSIRDTTLFVGLMLLESSVAIAVIAFILYRLDRWYARYLAKGIPKSSDVRAVRVRYTGTKAQELRLAVDTREQEFMVFASAAELRRALELAGQFGLET